jgi:hypothetical protein
VSKSLSPDFGKALGMEAPPAMPTAPFITLADYQRAVDKRVKAVDWNTIAWGTASAALNKYRGRV